VIKMVGETLADRYRITGRLAGGEMLSTYEAVDLALGTGVEIDVLAAGMEECNIAARRLEEILDAAMLVRGPHVSPVYGWGKEIGEGFIYVVREKAEGASLAEVLSGTGHLPRPQVTEITRAVVEVLAEAYGRDLFYLGLNPGQVLLDGRGGVKLFRVGFAWVMEEMDAALAARVSPYRAPETDGGREGSRNSDVYALAVMVREMLPAGSSSPRLDSLLEMAVDPFPKKRPSSPRLLLEELVERGDGGGRVLPHTGGGYASEVNAGSAGRGGGLGFLRRGEVAQSYVSLTRKPRRRILRNLLLMAAAGLTLWMVFAAVAGALGGKKPEEVPVTAVAEERVTLPDLQGLTARDAEVMLEGMGLICAFRESPSRLWSAGRVIAQEPEEGSSLLAGDVVCLVISTGREESGGLDEDSGDDASAPAPPAPEAADEPAPAAVSSPPSPHPPAAQRSLPTRNAPPHAVPVLSSRAGPAPLFVAMDASASYDPDGNIVRYIWHCGDGTVLQGINAQHVYDPAVIPARFRVVLEVFDAHGLSHSSALLVEVY
jgi:eukaryotic-like serine/threonine-protein kinase